MTASALLVVASMLVATERDAAAAEVVRLTVPYVKQTKALCGGAAAAMVFRYWGDGQADQNQFAPLLDSTASGIATDVLAQAIEDRGWRVVRFVGSVESVHDLLRDRRPVIVLLREGQGRFHYVVVVGTTDDHIVVHDPARGPSRRLTVQAFVKRWQPGGFWALLVLPPQRDARGPDVARPPIVVGAVSDGADPVGFSSLRECRLVRLCQIAGFVQDLSAAPRVRRPDIQKATDRPRQEESSGRAVRREESPRCQAVNREPS